MRIAQLLIKSKVNRIAFDLAYILIVSGTSICLIDEKLISSGSTKYIFLIISIFGIVDLIIIYIKLIILKYDVKKNNLIEMNFQYIKQKKIVHRSYENFTMNKYKLYGYILVLMKNKKQIKLIYLLNEPINSSRDNINISFDLDSSKSIVCEYYKNSKVIKRIYKILPNLNRKIQI